MKKGCILINRNICDNAEACGGIAVCPTEALFWDKEKEQVTYNADLCTSCKLCVDKENGCPLAGEALRYAETEEEYVQIEREINEDTRRFEDLKVERYGAEPIEECISINELDNWLEEQDKNSTLLVELFNDDSIQCLLNSIEVEDIQANVSGNSEYVKVQLEKEEDFTELTIEELPTLLIYKCNKLLGKIEGYYDESEQKSFFDSIQNILGQEKV